MDFTHILSLLVHSFLFTLATLLPMLNPPAAAPIYLSLTDGASTEDRTRLAKQVSINIFIMLSVAMIAGNVVLNLFGISLPIVRLGGGLLVISAAWNLVNSTDTDTSHAQKMASTYTWEQVKSKAFYPLTFPMLCGPGSISAALTVGATLHVPRIIDTGTNLIGSLAGTACAALAVYFCLRFASQFLYKLGTNGTAVLMRLSAFILLCLGVQIVWAGFQELFIDLLHQASQVTQHSARTTQP